MAPMRQPARPASLPHRSLLGLCLLGAPLLGCATPEPYGPMTHSDRVIQDVGAMIEGMARAHSEPPYAFVAPSLRSGAPR